MTDGGGGGGGGGAAEVGGGVDLDGGENGSGGGAVGGAGLDEVEGGGGGGGAVNGLLDDGGGGGGGGGASDGALAVGGRGGGAGGCPLAFREVGGGGGGLPNAIWLSPGFGAGLGGGFLRFASGLGIAGAESIDAKDGLPPLSLGNEGAAASGGGGAVPGGGLRADGIGRPVSESEWDDCSSAPVSTPPLVFFNFGIPPAKRPPNCGADSIVAAGGLSESLLLRFLFPPPGTGGASPVGGRIPGTGGAPLTGPPESDFLSITGADLSLVTVDFNLAPLLISDKRAPYQKMSAWSLYHYRASASFSVCSIQVLV